MKTGAILLAPIALAAASAINGAPPATAGFTVASLGQTVRVRNVPVTPLRVLEDSRCPKDARCLWAGRVRLSARVGRTVRELTLGQPIPVAHGTLELAAVVPERTTRNRTIQPNAYRFGFRVDRTGGMQLIGD
jgi:hypothetical protein